MCPCGCVRVLALETRSVSFPSHDYFCVCALHLRAGQATLVAPTLAAVEVT